jgi:hypothetical protein
MSRSRRQPIIKDRPKNGKKSSAYWRIVRRVINQKVRDFVDEIPENDTLPDPKIIVDDYNYCDYIIDYRDKPDGHKFKEKTKRK